MLLDNPDRPIARAFGAEDATHADDATRSAFRAVAQEAHRFDEVVESAGAAGEAEVRRPPREAAPDSAGGRRARVVAVAEVFEDARRLKGFVDVAARRGDEPDGGHAVDAALAAGADHFVRLALAHRRRGEARGFPVRRFAV